MKNKAEPLAYASTVLLLLVLTSLSISAQNFGGPLIGIPTSPIKYKYSNDRINDELFNLPMHEHVDYDLSDQHSWGSIDSDGIDEVLSYMYLGQSPKFGYQLVNDKAGNLLFCIIDNYIYNASGKGFSIDGDTLDCHTLTALRETGDPYIPYFNPYPDPSNINGTYCLYKNIIVVPDEQNCNEFYIFYSLSLPIHGAYVPIRVFYRKLTYIDQNNILISLPEELNNEFVPACDNSNNFSMVITPYNEHYQNYLLIIQYMGELFVHEIGNNSNIHTYKKIDIGFIDEGKTTANYYYRSNPVLINSNDEMILIQPCSGVSNQLELCYNRMPRNYANLSNQTCSVEFCPYDNGYAIQGIAHSPDNNYLYVTFNQKNGIHYFNISDYLQNSALPPTSYNSIATNYNFGFSDLSLDNSNKLLAISYNSTTELGALLTVNNPNNPTTSSISSNYLNLTNINLSYDKSFYEYSFIFPYLIYKSDYTSFYPINYSSQPDWSLIASNETWSPGSNNNPFGSRAGIVYFDENFEIPPGKYIQLNNMEFRFATEKNVVIDTASVLRLVNTKFSSDNSCGQKTMWQGIIVKGNSTISQNLNRQARLRLDGSSEISNATDAILVYGGGICQVYSGKFINNKRSITFNKYTNLNSSKIQLATFINDGSLNDQTNFIAHITLYNVKNINIEKCSFYNVNETGALPIGMGIRAYNNASFKVNNCDFEGLYYGISTTYNSTPNIVNNNFANNLGSLRILQSLNAKVSNNNFDGNLNFTPQTSNEPYSCYIAGNGVSNALLSFKNNTIQNGNIGVQFYNTGPNATSVSHNNFININETAQSCAATVIGKNSDYIENSGINKGDIGLEFRCNNFANSSYAIAVIDGNMCKYQGKNNALVGEDYAGNGFDHYGTNSERDFYVKIPIASHLDIPLYIYYSHADDEHKIIYYTSSKVYNVIRPLFYDEEDCAVDDNGGIILPGFKLNSGNDLIEDIDTEIMLKEYELLELTDNGQTYMLISKVESMNNLNSTKIADDIASLSGYISDELAISLIQNNEANQFAKANALIANSPLPINVKYHIDNMDMNIALKQHIKNHQNGVNPRNIKEAEIAQLKQHRSYIVSQMYDHAINNDSTPSEQQALEEFLINDKDINSKIYLFNFYKHNNNYEYAAITLNSIKSNLENNDLNYEMENYLSLEKIILDIEFEKTNLIDAVQNNLELINFIASNESHLGQVSAQLLLHDAGITEYNENIKLPEPALLTKNSRLEHKVEQLYKYNDIINIYPNPSKDVFYIEYALFDNEQDLTIQIISIDGTVIDNIKLNQNIGVFVYNKQLSAGIYTVKVGNKFVRKIVINN